MNVAPIFLSKEYCLKFASYNISKYGENGKLANMTDKRIATEIFAHAVVYYGSFTGKIAVEVMGWDKSMIGSKAMVLFDKAMLAANDEGGGMGLNVNNNDKKWLGYYLVWNVTPGTR